MYVYFGGHNDVIIILESNVSLVVVIETSLACIPRYGGFTVFAHPAQEPGIATIRAWRNILEYSCVNRDRRGSRCRDYDAKEGRQK